MAEQVVSIDIAINAANAANTVKDLKSNLKSLKNELNNVEAGSAEFNKLSKAINNTEGRLGDLNDSFNTLTGSGVERTTKSFNLLKEGFATFDFGKIKASLGGLTAAFKAVPIFLLVEGITYLISNFKELSEGTGILAQVLKPIGDLFTWITDKVYAFTDAIGLTNKALEDQQEQIKVSAENTTKALEAQTSEYDRQIKAAKAAGKETIELEKAKQDAIIETNKKIVEQELALIRSSKTATKEQLEIVNKSLNAIKDANTEKLVIQSEHDKEADKKNQEAHEKWKKINDQRLLEEKTRFEAKQALDNEDYDNEIKVTETKVATKEEIEAAAQAEALNMSAWKYNTEKAQLDKDLQDKQEAAEKEKQHRRDVANTSVELTSQSIKAAQGISDLYFAQQLKSAKGNAEKEKEIRKKQFNVNKAFGITNAVIDGVRGVQAALAMGPPIGYVFAALTAVMAGINVAQIASAKFDEGGGSSGGNVGASIGSIGSVGAEPPQIKSPNNTVTKIDDSGKIQTAQPTVKAVVVETDVTEKQKRVDNMKEVATF